MERKKSSKRFQRSRTFWQWFDINGTFAIDVKPLRDVVLPGLDEECLFES